MIIADKIASLFTVQGVLAALHARERTGLGDRVTVPMLDSLAYFDFPDLLEGEMFIDEPGTGRRAEAYVAARARDGYLVIAPTTGAQIKRTLEVVGHPEWRDQLVRYSDRSEFLRGLIDLIEPVLSTAPGRGPGSTGSGRPTCPPHRWSMSPATSRTSMWSTTRCTRSTATLSGAGCGRRAIPSDSPVTSRRWRGRTRRPARTTPVTWPGICDPRRPRTRSGCRWGLPGCRRPTRMTSGGPVDLSSGRSFVGGFPHEFFAWLRREHPVWWHPPTENTPDGVGFWVVSRHAEAVAIMRDPVTFSSGAGGTAIVDTPGAKVTLNQSDDPQHHRLRSLVNRGFTPTTIGRLEGDLRARAESIVDAVPRGGAV